MTENGMEGMGKAGKADSAMDEGMEPAGGGAWAYECLELGDYALDYGMRMQAGMGMLAGRRFGGLAMDEALACAALRRRTPARRDECRLAVAAAEEEPICGAYVRRVTGVSPCGSAGEIPDGAPGGAPGAEGETVRL